MDVFINTATAISGLFGGLLATGAAIYFQMKFQKKKLILSLIDSYLEYAPLRASVKWILDSCINNNYKCIYPDNNASVDDIKLANENYNKLIKLGDWYEIVETLHRSDLLDTHLFDVTGLRSQVINFRESLSKIDHDNAKSFPIFWKQLFEIKIEDKE